MRGFKDHAPHGWQVAALAFLRLPLKVPVGCPKMSVERLSPAFRFVLKETERKTVAIVVGGSPAKRDTGHTKREPETVLSMSPASYGRASVCLLRNVCFNASVAKTQTKKG